MIGLLASDCAHAVLTASSRNTTTSDLRNERIMGVLSWSGEGTRRLPKCAVKGQPAHRVRVARRERTQWTAPRERSDHTLVRVISKLRLNAGATILRFAGGAGLLASSAQSSCGTAGWRSTARAHRISRMRPERAGA